MEYTERVGFRSLDSIFEEKININDIDLRNASYVEMSALEAVSYTHLDVYKRQVLECCLNL